MIRFITRTRAEGLIMLVFAIWYVRQAYAIPDMYSTPGVPGPAVFPIILGVVFSLTALWLIVLPREKGEKAEESEEEKTAGSVQKSLLKKVAGKWHFGSMWAVLCAYLFFMPVVGFPVSTFLLLVAFFALLGERRWVFSMGVAVAATALIYAGLGIGLSLRLPLGVLEPLVK